MNRTRLVLLRGMTSSIILWLPGYINKTPWLFQSFTDHWINFLIFPAFPGFPWPFVNLFFEGFAFLNQSFQLVFNYFTILKKITWRFIRGLHVFQRIAEPNKCKNLGLSFLVLYVISSPLSALHPKISIYIQYKLKT